MCYTHGAFKSMWVLFHREIIQVTHGNVFLIALTSGCQQAPESQDTKAVWKGGGIH